MYSLLSAADPSSGVFDFLFTQGVLGTCLVMAIIVIVYQQKKLDKKDDKLDAQFAARLEDHKAHTTDYREMAKNDQMVLAGNSQANELLAGKIEAVRGK